MAEAGLLKEKHATPHWGHIENLRKRNIDLTVQDSFRWIDDGFVATSGGISA